MEVVTKKISELSLAEAFEDRLTNTPCAYINVERDVWVATEMLAQYLESVIDSIVVRNNDKEPVGIVGGYDLLDCIVKHPTRTFQYECKVKDVMVKDFLIVDKNTKIENLAQKWKQTRRAFAITPNDFGGYSPISVRKMLELAVRAKTDILISSMPEKRVITFEADEPLGNVIQKMFENKTRKLLLEFSNQFISDRLILHEISDVLKFSPHVENLLDIPVSQIELEEAKVLKTDLKLDKLAAIMYDMEHPYVIYKDITISPWDVTMAILNEQLKDGRTEIKKILCPHCGNEFPL